MFTRAIVRPPGSNFAEGLSTAGLGRPDYRRALEQHEDYCAALEKCGLTLTKLEADQRYPDSCFVEDTAVLLPHEDIKARALTRRVGVLTRPGAPTRQGEVESMRSVLADFFPSLLEIRRPGTVDGGDVCEAGNHFFIGISRRTNKAGAQQLAEVLKRHGYTSSFVDISNSAEKSVPGAIATGSLLHLKSELAYLGDNRLVVTTSLADRAEFDSYDLIRVDANEEYAANCVRLNERVLVAAGCPKFETKLRELGYQTITLGMSEFEKMDGGLSCLSLRF